jgi:hypothetical protein
VLNTVRKILGIIMHDILDVIKNIKELYESNSNLAVLKDFERVLDEMDVYVYENWEDGELAYGPEVSRHWVKAGFMWPYSSMPDPVGAKRLADIGCNVKYKTTHLIAPKPIKTPEDLRPGTNKGKLEHNPIWMVEITMPRKLVFDVYKGYMSKLREEIKGNSEELKTTTPAPMDAASAGAPAAPGGATAAPAAPAAPAA